MTQNKKEQSASIPPEGNCHIEKCHHNFRLANFGQEPTGGTSWINVVYVCCTKCGEVKKQEIK